MNTQPALLALADGSVFEGVAIGALGQATGEVVFNTAITGYQEILTDPSYSKQIVTLTYPHIGNTGVNKIDIEAKRTFCSGLVIRDLPKLMSSWRAEMSLSDYLEANNIVAIANVDTRRLTRILRDNGAQGGCIIAGEIDQAAAIEAAKAFPGLQGMDLAKEATTDSSYIWRTPSWTIDDYLDDAKEKADADLPYHVVAYDFGVKQNILRMLVDRGCKVTVVPATTPVADVKAMNPDGVFLSNGPGDPEPCDYAIENIKGLIEWGVPVFGICLGHQLLSLAAGAKTIKMKFGHHGANHPVQDVNTKVVAITSQNHGFAVDADTLPNNVEVTHISLFDQSLQGIRLTNVPAFSFQGHPEASPGPHDLAPLFDQFVDNVKTYNQ